MTIKQTGPAPAMGYAISYEVVSGNRWEALGVNIYILDRRPARLSIAGVEQNIGTLRRFWKITELDSERAGELVASEAVVASMPSPAAALVPDVYDLPLAENPGVPADAHLVIGWDEGRTKVTDMKWDYLPELGYGLRDPSTGIFVLHEERDGALRPFTRERAIEAGLVSGTGMLLRHGQPAIIECRSVVPFLNDYADADCTLEGGRGEKLLIGISGGELPDPSWFVGKRPMDVERYAPARPGDAPPDPGLPRPEP